MSEKLSHQSGPVRAADLTPEWIAERRAIVIRDGHAMRAGAGPWIEIQSINQPDTWLTLGLPGKTPLFASAEDRDQILESLWRTAQPEWHAQRELDAARKLAEADKPAVAEPMPKCKHGIDLDIPCVLCIQEKEKAK